ncbi:hypothetical protein [Xanthovirga aplysinae]|uniref:hypothetical protein n=1 Tax=Xanthovirga aplysinae TaxID=2529853 RepID=UPI0012BB6C04|nr:hypothetical protein [Xanthovirga aplysinae]MTI29399.1 hypothetical protein [Xanthovirga aplysinae]
MRLLIINILLLISTKLCAQTDLGIGIVSIDFDDKTILEFFKDSSQTDPIKVVEFFNDPAIKSWNIKNLQQQRNWLKPEILWLDYYAFNFRCISKNENWFEVIVNNELGQTYWIKSSESTKFKNWENYLKGMFSVARLSEQPQKIRSAPVENAKEMDYQGRDCFVVKSMKGDWIEITTPPYCDENYTDSKTPIKSGWIKWKVGNTLLIQYFTTS